MTLQTPDASTLGGATPKSRQRTALFLVTSAVALAVIVGAREVLLPFVLALVIAYVLSPLVVWPARNGYVMRTAHEPKDEPFDLKQLVSDALGKSVSYAQHNALELARIGRDIISAVSRTFFVFGITLMLAAYTMLTREK